MAGAKGLARRLRGVTRARLQALDVVVAALLSVLVTAAVVQSSHGASLALALPSALLASTAVAYRRRAPRAAVVATIAGPVGWSLTVASHNLVGGLPILLALYTAASRGTSRRYLRELGVMVLGGVGACVAIAAGSGSLNAASVATIALPLVIGPAVAGYLVARQRAIAGSLEDAVNELRAEEDARLIAVRVRERNRVARDMHDVVAHGVSAMVVQAGAARTVLDAEPELAVTALEEIVHTGGDALADLGRIVGTLDASDGSRDGGHIGIAALPALLDRRRREGLPAQLVVAGEPRLLAGTADEAVYRSVEEALTNVVKHADCAPTRVTLAFGEQDLRVTVCNDRPPHAEASMAATGSRLGLVGMRERMEACQGTLSFGERPDGYTVEAVVPFRAEAPEGLPDASKARPDGLSFRRWIRRWGLWSGVALTSVVLGADVFISNDRRGPLVLNLVLVLGMAFAVRWCRRFPLGFLVAVNLLALPLSNGLTAVNSPTLVSTFVFVVPVWVVAVWEDDARAWIGLGVAVTFGAGEGLYWHEAGSVAANIVLTIALWFVGRVIHAQRLSADELELTRARVEQEQRNVEMLTLSTERASLAAGLHREVALAVTEMIGAAESVLETLRAIAVPPAETREVLDNARVSIGRIEHAGRAALIRLREILGILRADLDPAPLSPHWVDSPAGPTGAVTAAAGGAP